MIDNLMHSVAHRTVFITLCVYSAPVCFNTTFCEGEPIGDNLLSFDQCCFELSAVSFASSGQCMVCPVTGKLICMH